MNIEAEKLREAAYWRERLNILRAANARMSAQTYKEVEAAFDLAQRDIQRDIDAWLTRVAKNNGIVDMAAARRLLDAGELKEFKWDVNEYIRHGKENAVSGKWTKQLENASARVHISRLEALKIQTQNHLETVFAVENSAVESLAKDVYKSGYYRTVYELQKGAGVGFDIAGLDTKRLDAVAHKPWSLDARTFSDRIWGQKDKMVGALHQEIIRNCIYGRSQKDAAKALEQYVKKDVKNAEYCARRVIVTETAYFSALSQRDGLLELDCEWYEIDLPIDARSCALCRDMNGRRFKMSEFEVGATAPPFHPYCANGAIIPYFDDDFDVDTDREGAREISEDVSFGDWEREFVKNDLTNDGEGGIIKSESELKKIIGEHSIESDLEAVNPNYSVGIPYKNNCGNCVATLELRRRGFDVEARPSTGRTVQEVLEMFDGFIPLGFKGDRYKSFSVADIVADIVKTVKGWGNGARGIITIKWKHLDSRHFFSIEVKNGKVLFVDSQTERDIKSVFNNADILETMFGRTDNLKIKDSILTACKNKR